MKTVTRFLPWCLLALFAAEVIVAMLPRKDPDFRVRDFGSLPVLLNGRVQPFDSVARNALLQIRGTASVPLEEKKMWEVWKHPKKLKASPWILEVMLRPELADQRPIFLIHHPELLGELKLEGKGIEKSGLRYYSFNDIRPVLPEIGEQSRKAGEIESQVRNAYQKQAVKLGNAVTLYHRLKNSLRPEDSDDFAKEVAGFEKAIEPGVAALRAREANKPADEAAIERLLKPFNRFQGMMGVAYPLIVPPLTPGAARDNWVNAGASLLESMHTGRIHPAMTAYAAMATAYRQNQVDAFNRALGEYRQWLAPGYVRETRKAAAEFFYNSFQPFLRAMIIYIFAFLLACGFWFNWSEWLRRSAVYLLMLAVVVHTAGLVFRMVLEGRPPVTNLYSSAIFIGWGAVVLGLILERIYKDGIGSVCAAVIGFVTQIIAHNLALGGDTMEMLRAVLDTNFWLATHVITITLGYSACFFAGVLAIIYVLRGVLTCSLSELTGKALTRMVYGIICFATLFSFVGTVLGGIWADQSWGRFWGWDPKENGALIIVLWNVAILHARWAGLIRERGLMNMAIFGNVVTAFSWFGVNMLGIGLHSYGFMDAAFKWLMIFVLSQVFLIFLGCLPRRYWLSFRGQVEAGVTRPATSGGSRPAVGPAAS